MHFAELLKVEFVITPVLVNGGYWAHAGGVQQFSYSRFSIETHTLQEAFETTRYFYPVVKLNRFIYLISKVLK